MTLPAELAEDFDARAMAIIRTYLRQDLAGFVALTGDDADEILPQVVRILTEALLRLVGQDELERELDAWLEARRQRLAGHRRCVLVVKVDLKVNYNCIAAPGAHLLLDRSGTYLGSQLLVSPRSAQRGRRERGRPSPPSANSGRRPSDRSGGCAPCRHYRRTEPAVG